MSRSTRQFATHLERQGRPPPPTADLTGHPWPHLQPLGAATQGPAVRPPPAKPTAEASEAPNVALRGADELLRLTEARRAADARLVVTLSLGELRDLMREAALEAVAEASQEVRPALLDRVGLAQAIGIGVSTVDRLRREGLPCVHVGDSPRFELANCLAWLRSRRQP